jgi:hypothetical protein
MRRPRPPPLLVLRRLHVALPSSHAYNVASADRVMGDAEPKRALTSKRNQFLRKGVRLGSDVTPDDTKVQGHCLHPGEAAQPSDSSAFALQEANGVTDLTSEVCEVAAANLDVAA